MHLAVLSLQFYNLIYGLGWFMQVGQISLVFVPEYIGFDVCI